MGWKSKTDKNAYWTRWKNGRLASGTCLNCPEPSKAGQQYCDTCGFMRRAYRLGLDEFQMRIALDVYLTFGGKCQCCGTTEPGTRGWEIDHDHTTHAFRGIICRNCNSLLGHAKDSIDRLAAGITYLKRFM